MEGGKGHELTFEMSNGGVRTLWSSMETIAEVWLQLLGEWFKI